MTISTNQLYHKTQTLQPPYKHFCLLQKCIYNQHKNEQYLFNQEVMFISILNVVFLLYFAL